MHAPRVDGTDLVDIVESGGAGGTKEVLAVSRSGAIRHWRDIKSSHHKLDLQLDELKGATVEVSYN